jgi:predicted nucleic acid-binding protein
MNRVFVDTGVLITAFRGELEMREHALTVLSEPEYEFWYSPLLRLETTLQPFHNNRKAEMTFYQEYFKHAQCFGDLNRIFEIGEPDAMKHGIPVMDALHIAAANLSRCKVLFTTEAPTKPLFRTKLVKVASILTPVRRSAV